MLSGPQRPRLVPAQSLRRVDLLAKGFIDSMHHTRVLRKLSPVCSHSKGLSNCCVLLSFCLAYCRSPATLHHNATRSSASINTSSRLSLPHPLPSKYVIASACHYSSQAQSANSPSPDKYALQEHDLTVPLDCFFLYHEALRFSLQSVPHGTTSLRILRRGTPSFQLRARRPLVRGSTTVHWNHADRL